MIKTSFTQTQTARNLAVLPLALTLSAVLFSTAHAQQTAVSFTPNYTGIEDTASLDFADPTTGAYDEKASYNLGWEFTVNAPITVTRLGFFADPSYYDPNNPSYNVLGSSSQAFAQSHAVGLYQVNPGAPETGSLLFSANVTQNDTLTNSFRYALPTLAAGVSSFTLMPGSYVVAGVTGADDPFLEDVQAANAGSALVTAPGITFDENRVTSGSSLLSYPATTEPLTEPGYFGPNFQFQPVPEASTTLSFALLLAMGLGSIALHSRRIKKS